MTTAPQMTASIKTRTRDADSACAVFVFGDDSRSELVQSILVLAWDVKFVHGSI